MKTLITATALGILSIITGGLPVSANSGLLLEDLGDFSPNAEYSQGSDGHVIIDCWREPWGNGGEAIIATWRLRAYHSSLLYVNGAVAFSNSVIPKPLNGSPFGFSVPLSRVASGSEELYLKEPLSADETDIGVFATITGAVEIGMEGGGIIPTSASCPLQ